VKPDPNWPRASDWLAGDHDPEPVGRLAVLGVPLRLGSISGGRFDLAPNAIRRALARYSTWYGGMDDDVRSVAAADLGDVQVAQLRPEEAKEPLQAAVSVAATQSDAVVILGGDNSLTRPAVHGLDAPLDRIGLLTLDAHLDFRDLEAGLNNGNPIRALLEDGLPGGNVAQIGIQEFANSRRYLRDVSDAGITWVPADEVGAMGIVHAVQGELDDLAGKVDAIYVDLDLDVLDRAFAPACPGARPGGLQSWEVIRAARLFGKHPTVRAMDLVEVDPERDVADATVLTAAACLLSFAAGLAERAEGES
jgi:formiminoglutamase